MDFNLWEITALVVLAIIIFGPEKLPELARKAARVLNHLRRIGNDARGQLRKELGPEFDDISLSDLNPRAFVAKHLLSGEEVEDLRQIREEALSSGSLIRDTLDDAKAQASEKTEPGASDATEVTDMADASASSPAPEQPIERAVDAVLAEAAPSPLARVPFDPEAT